MKKLTYVLMLVGAVLLSNQTYAQMPVDKGTKFLNAGVGLGGYGGWGYLGTGSIALGASLELGVAKNITAGVAGTFRTFSNVGSSYVIGARGSYHFNEILNINDDKVDLYAGLGLGYSGFSWKSSYAGIVGSNGSVVMLAHLGGRYFFANNLGAFAEVGYGVAPLQVGVTFKF